MATIQLDFTNLCAAQDMIAIIQKERNCTVQEAILFSINSANCKSIMATGWASIAYSLWGHDDPERKWLFLNSPKVDVEFSETDIKYLKKVAKAEKVKVATAVCYFLVFTMKSLGYHI